MSASENEKRNKKYKLVPPDGGWGYLICVAVIINFATTTGFISSFGLLFNDFMNELKMSSTAITMVNGIAGMCAALSGFFTNSLLKLMSMRKLALLSAVLFDVGVLGTVFSESQFTFFLTQGIMQGLGSGILITLSFSILNDYFVERRFFATSCIQVVSAISAMVAPVFVTRSLHRYGYRGTLLIITGLSLQNIFATALMQPAMWHMKRIKIQDESEEQRLIMEKEKMGDMPVTPIIKLSDAETGDSTEYKLAGEESKPSIFKKIMLSLIDVEVCKTLLVSCTCLGPAICTFADTMYGYILPQALYERNWNQEDAALALSLIGFGDLAARVLMVCTSKWITRVGNQELYIMGIMLAFLSRLGVQWTQNVIAIYISVTLIGFSRCGICVLGSLVLAEVVRPEKFTSALGVQLLLAGHLFVIMGPVVGAIRDLTQSYSAPFFLLSSLFAIVGIFWCIELCYKKNKHKRELRQLSLQLKK